METAQCGPLLMVRDLKTYYNKNSSMIRSVDGVSFDLRAGERMGIAGESGSGKTQTVLSIMGLNENTPGLVDGEITIKGDRLTRDLHAYCHIQERNGRCQVNKNVRAWQQLYEQRIKPLRGNTLSMVFQEPKSSLSPYFTVREQLHETFDVLSNRASAVDSFEGRVIPILERLKFRYVKRILAAYPHQLSGGEAQRIMLALAMIGQPELLIADEPTTQLDALTQYNVVKLFESFLGDAQLSLLFISHNLALVAHLVDTVMIMFRGRVVEMGPVKELMMQKSDRRHPYTQELIQAFSGIRAGNNSGTETPQNGSLVPGCCYQQRCLIKSKLDATQKNKCQHEIPPLIGMSDGHGIACWQKE